MVGLFSRFTVKKSMHRRTQSARLDERDVLPANAEVVPSVAASAAATATSHGIEVAVEFKPVEHPVEPLDNDRPVQCPLPEPSILNDGRIWKERASATMHRRGDLPVMKEGEPLEQEGGGGGGGGNTRPRRSRSNRMILPSVSAPEHNLLKLLEESGI